MRLGLQTDFHNLHRVCEYDLRETTPASRKQLKGPESSAGEEGFEDGEEELIHCQFDGLRQGVNQSVGGMVS